MQAGGPTALLLLLPKFVALPIIDFGLLALRVGELAGDMTWHAVNFVPNLSCFVSTGSEQWDAGQESQWPSARTRNP